MFICEPQFNSCPDTLTIDLGVVISTHFMCYSRRSESSDNHLLPVRNTVFNLDFEFWHFLIWTIICCRGEDIFASQGLRFGSPFSPSLADLEYIFEDSRFNISLVTATSTRIQSEDVLHGAHVIREM